ncbi:MAG TPA: SulP family inorganic anion transporter [Syntrophorhabdales bacterium]|nr:SulP family inorganic anion transporter [Syntrophorhabdales bacterium]
MIAIETRTNPKKDSYSLNKFVPLLNWVSRYRLSWLRNDLIAGFTVWAVMVPTALAYTGIAGVPPVIGLYTVPLALVGYAVFGTSRLLVVGPDSATALLSAHTVGLLVAQGSSDYLALTSALALLVGLFFLGFGILRMGWLANFIAQPVMKGFIQGLALVTIMTQLPKMFGVESVSGDFFQRLWALALELPNTHLLTLAVGLGGLLVLLTLTHVLPKFPAALTTIMGAILTVTVFNLHQRGVAIVGVITTNLPPIGLPHLPPSHLATLIQGALAIVLLNYSESLGAAKAAALVTGEEIDPGQELVGLGMANVGSSLSSGFVVAGSLSQSAVSMGAGGKTQMAGLFHAIFIILTLLILMPLFKNMPYAVLGAIVVGAMIRMLDFGYFRRLSAISKMELIISLAAFLGVLILGVLPGVGLGVVLSLVVLIHQASHPATAVLGKMPGQDVYRNIRRRLEAKTVPGLLIFRLDGNLFFANATYCAEQVKQAIREATTPVEEVLMDYETINFVDTTAADMLVKLHAELAGEDITLCMARVRDSVRGMLRRMGVEAVIGADHMYDSITQGVQAFSQRHRAHAPAGRPEFKE